MTKEGDAEHLLRIVGEYVTTLGKSTDPDEVKSALAHVVPEDNKDALLSTLVRASITRKYLVTLYSCGPIFRLSKSMSKRWMRDNINGVFGGVSDLFCQ